MTRTARRIVSVAVGLLALPVAAMMLFILLIDPNDFRDSLQKLARENANIELRLSGDLGWSFFPVLGFAAETVGVGLQPEAPELASINRLAVGVKLLPLLRQSLQIDAIEVDGLTLDLQVDKQGRGNWQRSADTDSQTETGQTPSTAPAALDLNIATLRISDSQLSYSDAQSASRYDVVLDVLELQDFRFDQPAALTLAATVTGVLPEPLPINADAAITVASSGEQLQLSVEALQLASLRAHGLVDVGLADDAMQYRGEWAVDTFNPRQWMQAAGMPAPETQDKSALGRASFAATFTGDEQSLAVNPLVISLDDSRISGSLEMTDISRQAVRFALLIDQINLDRYQSPETTSTAPAGAGTKTDDELIPVELLKSLEMEGSLQIGQLVMSAMPLSDVRVMLRAKAGKLLLDLQQVALLSGAASGSLNLDVSSGEPVLQTDIGLRDIALGGLLSHWLQGEFLTGKTSTRLALTTRGNDMDSLLRAALGQLDLQLDEAVIHGLNINELAVSQVREKLGDFALLYPNYQEKLPGSLKRDTEINSLLTQWRIEKGRLILPNMNTETSEGSLSLAGNIDLLGEGFDFRLGVVPEALQSNKYLGGIQWSVRCSALWDAPISSWCRADGKQFESVLQAAAKSAAKDKASQKLAEELGVEGENSADLEEAARQRARERAREEEDRLKQKARDKINKKLNKLLEP